MRRAVTRGIPKSFADALSATPPTTPIDVALAKEQHAEYVAALEAMGVVVTQLPADDALPDSCFVEDTAVIAEGLALVTRPGAPSRQSETPAIAEALAPRMRVVRMEAPATLDGGDCMRMGRTIFVGRSKRTNDAGVARLADAFAALRLHVVEVELPPQILHLKCVSSPLGADRMLLAEGTLDPAPFGDALIIWVPPAEAYAANAVCIGDKVMMAAGYPITAARLRAAGFFVQEVPTSEVQKADGSLTCQSLLW